MKRFWIVFLVLLGVNAAIVSAMIRSDRKWLAGTCTKQSAALEWVASPSQAEQIVDDWRAVPGAVKGVTYGILIDFLFIVAYVALGRWTLLRGCAVAVPEISWWSGTAGALARWIGWAGAFDVIENAGILLEVHARWYWLAPVTTFFAWMKWIIVILVLVFVVFTVVLALRRWDAQSDEQRREIGELESVGARGR